MTDVLTLVSRAYEDDGYTLKGGQTSIADLATAGQAIAGQEIVGTPRDVFCRLESVGRTEFYQAQATDLRPELVFVLADYLDYDGEFLCIYGGAWYRVIRTYRKGQELEIVVQRASAEEVEAGG